MKVFSLQYSLQLVDTVGANKTGRKLEVSAFLESFSISVLISRIKHFLISIRCSWVDYWLAGSSRLWKERNDVNLTQNNTVFPVISSFYGQEKLVYSLIKKIETVKKELECKVSKWWNKYLVNRSILSFFLF